MIKGFILQGDRLGYSLRKEGCQHLKTVRMKYLPQEIVSFPSLVLYQLAVWPLSMGVREFIH